MRLSAKRVVTLTMAVIVSGDAVATKGWNAVVTYTFASITPAVYPTSILEFGLRKVVDNNDPFTLFVRHRAVAPLLMVPLSTFFYKAFR